MIQLFKLQYSAKKKKQVACIISLPDQPAWVNQLVLTVEQVPKF